MVLKTQPITQCSKIQMSATAPWAHLLCHSSISSRKLKQIWVTRHLSSGGPQKPDQTRGITLLKNTRTLSLWWTSQCNSFNIRTRSEPRTDNPGDFTVNSTGKKLPAASSCIPRPWKPSKKATTPVPSATGPALKPRPLAHR